MLKKVIENGDTGQMMLTALGPGFTASFLPLTIGVNADGAQGIAAERAGRQYA